MLSLAFVHLNCHGHGVEGGVASIVEAPMQLGYYPVTWGDTSAWFCGPQGALEELVLPQSGTQGLTFLLALQQCEPLLVHLLLLVDVLSLPLKAPWGMRL